MKIDKKVIKFVENNKICVLATLLSDGKPHTATMHYANMAATLDFVFFTKPDSRKCESIEIGKKYPASLVVGFSEEEWIEFQAEGHIEMIERKNSDPYINSFAGKFKGAGLDIEHVVLKFTTDWWRYTEFKPEFKKIESE
jgi:general stress protein 26